MKAQSPRIFVMSERTVSKRIPLLRGRWLAALVATGLIAAVACGSEADSPGSAVDGSLGADLLLAEDRELPPAVPTAAPVLDAGGLIVNKNGPELIGNQLWFNSEPTSIGQLAADGRVVLIDFWTYTCINCIRTFPFLREWDQKYRDRGLTILGVHSPEFDFEKIPDNVQNAIDRYDLQYPTVQDNEMKTWNAFSNQFWPAKYLFNTDGEITYTHFGEGEYIDTERQIRGALEAAGYDISDIPIGTDEGLQRDPLATGQTRELYGGYDRNFTYAGLYAGQPEYYDSADTEALYLDNLPHRDGQWYVQGVWKNTGEAIVHTRDTVEYEDYLVFKFLARSVVVVIDPQTPGAEFDVIIEVDGKPIRRADAGEDIEYDDEGRSFIRVDRGKEYKVLEQQESTQREMKLLTNSADFAFFAATFGNNLDGA
ncbi:MAG: redoxin domain-containing protein [Chloroflexi bacterium]|nr:redoxin domain-containing protein [Chloroflexota bacterium]